MRLEFTDDDRMRVATPADEVRAVLAEPVELLAMFGDLLDPASRPHRWVGPELHAGPAALAVVLEVAVEAIDRDRVEVRGRQAPGHTPASLDIDLHVEPEDDDTSRLACRWRFTMEMPGPRMLARTLHPVVTHSSRRTTRVIRERLAERFGGASTGVGVA